MSAAAGVHVDLAPEIIELRSHGNHLKQLRLQPKPHKGRVEILGVTPEGQVLPIAVLDVQGLQEFSDAIMSIVIDQVSPAGEGS